MKLIQLENYLLLIDEEAEIKEWDYYYDLESKLAPVKQSIENSHKDFKSCKIIAFYPLTKKAIKFDLLLLPNPFEKDIIMYNLLNKDIPSVMSNYGKADGTRETSIDYNKGHRDSWIKGYKAAQPKQFSLEDMKKAFEAGVLTDLFNTWGISKEDFAKEKAEQYIQSLSTQQLPKEFIPEYQKDWKETTKMLMESMGDNPEDFKYEETLKTITNSEGKEILVGTYKY